MHLSYLLNSVSAKFFHYLFETLPIKILTLIYLPTMG